jgi:hypothetical protein
MIYQFRKFSESSLNVFADKSIIFDKVFRIIDNDVPSSSFKVYRNVLFFPESPDYPGVDFLIWSTEDEVLLAFQIAINKLNDRKNADNFINGSNGSLKNKWANLFRIDESKVYFILIAHDNDIYKVTKSSFNELYIPFSNIKDQFPALAGL